MPVNEEKIMATTLDTKNRDKSKKAKALRKEGTIPATLYGPEIESADIQLNAKEFSRVPFEDYSHLIHLKGDLELQFKEGVEADKSGEYEVLIKKVQKDVISHEVQNIEFYKVMRGHKVTMKVALKFSGNSEAVKMGADFVPVSQEVNIKCLPKHIPYFIDVSIEKLQEAGDFITFAELDVNRDEIEILDPPKEIICKAQAKRKAVDTPAASAGEAAADAPAAEEKKD